MCYSDPNLSYLQRMEVQNRHAWCCFGIFFMICGFVAMGFAIVLSRTEQQSTYVPLFVLSIGFIFCGLIFSDAHRFNYFKAFRRMCCSNRCNSISRETDNLYPQVPEYVITISPSSPQSVSQSLQTNLNLKPTQIDPPSKLSQSLPMTPSRTGLDSIKSIYCLPPSQLEVSRSYLDPPSQSCHLLPTTPSQIELSRSRIDPPSQSKLSLSQIDSRLSQIDSPSLQALSLPRTPSQTSSSMSMQSYCQSPSQSEIRDQF